MTESASANPATERFLRLPEVRQRTGLSKSQIYWLIQQKQFPPPIKLGIRASAWLNSEICRWMGQRIKQRPQH